VGQNHHLFHFHGYHDQSQAANDPTMATNHGIRTVWLALLSLILTTSVQAIIVAISQSTALLADMVHNMGDTVNEIPCSSPFILRVGSPPPVIPTAMAKPKTSPGFLWWRH
jgi:hypothetical protein